MSHDDPFASSGNERTVMMPSPGGRTVMPGAAPPSAPSLGPLRAARTGHRNGAKSAGCGGESASQRRTPAARHAQPSEPRRPARAARRSDQGVREPGPRRAASRRRK